MLSGDNKENTHYSSQIPSNGASAAQATPYVLASLFSKPRLDGSLTKQKARVEHTSLQQRRQ